jgi:predicted secreted protein
MKRIVNTAAYLVLAAFLSFAVACKKDSAGAAKTINLTAADSNKTVSVIQGEKILITLGNPGDGGYSFDNWQYSSSVLTLVGHSHANPPANAPIGDFGSDTWQFTAKATGSSALKITASRNTADVVTMFKGTIQVQ